jgi:hypothetical protein
MSKKPARNADALKAQLQAISTPERAPGKEQADRALNQHGPTTESGGGVAVAEPPPVQVLPTKPVRKPKAPAPAVTESPVEKVTVQLYAEDVRAMDKVEATLKKYDLVGRTVPSAHLMRVALALFDDKANRSALTQVIESIKAKDGRGKWRN